MPQQQAPFLEGKYGWNFGESGWDTGMNENLLKFSFMFDRNVDGVVSTLPAAVNGKAYFLTTDNRLYFTVNTTYFSCPTPKWFEFVVRGTGVTYQFNGTSAIQVESLIGVDSRLDAMELSVASLGTASSKDVDFFASTARVDVVEANAQSTTDRAVQVVGDYAAGLVLSNRNQGFRYLGDIYLPGDGITLPYTTTGVGAAEVATFRSVGDAILRSDLATTLDPLKGAALVGYKGRTVADELGSVVDVLDSLTMLIQQENANSQGAIRVAVGDPDPQRLVPASQRAGLLLGFDAQGQPVAVAPVSGSVVSAESLGALPDGSDVSAQLQAGLDAGKTVVLTAGKTYVAKNLQGVTGAALVCLVGRATITVPAGSGFAGISITTPNFTLDGVNFSGGNLGPYKLVSAVAGTRSAVIVGNPFGTGNQLYDVTVQNCDIYGFDLTGVRGRETVVGFSFGKRVVFNNVNCHHNYVNWWLEERFEYSTMTNCYGYEGYAGIISIGGNNTAVACHFEENFNNCQLSAGENNAHGQFVACSFNHAAAGGLGLIGLDITNGHLFIGCAFWYSPITLIRCIGVMISKCQIANSPITINGGGLNFIDDNWMPTGVTKTFIGITFTSFRRNRTTAADTSLVPIYGDVTVCALASTFAYPIAWNATANSPLPLSFSTKKWNGEDAAFLDDGGGMYVPRTGAYQIDARIHFTVGASAEQVTLTVGLYTGATQNAALIESREFTASAVGGVVSLNTKILATHGQTLRLLLRTKTATGIVINTGGVNVLITSID